MTPQVVDTASIFEERAENLGRDDFYRLTADTPRDRGLIKKLMGSGLKLLTGPRGSGKSTLLRSAYFNLLDDTDVMGAYINFSKSLALEPLFLQKANALQIFRQWVMYKLLIGVAEGLRESERALHPDLAKLEVSGLDFIHNIETSQSGSLPTHLIAPSEFVLLIEKWLLHAGATRCVLLLDDAAHAFSSEQQREFFEIFRALRSRRISAKAAVYPGITTYSPFFHVGHEAEELQVWHSPEDESYLEQMRALAKQRLTLEMSESFADRTELIDYLALASFGLPRGFLNMLSHVLGLEDSDIPSRPTRARADKAIALHAESVENIFGSLKGKLPRYKHFIEVGTEMETNISTLLKTFNVNKVPGKAKAFTVGIAEPVSNEVSSILGMAQYAGILRREGNVSRGEKGVFQRYTLHFSIILRDNSLSLGKSPSVKDAVSSLASNHAHSFARAKEASLLPKDYKERCTLDLAPCKRCGVPRLSDEARFCMNCGNELTSTSIYLDLISRPIDVLPLTKNKVNGLREHTSIRTVQDVIMDEERNEIRRVPYIGAVWSSRIHNAAQEYVSV